MSEQNWHRLRSIVAAAALAFGMLAPTFAAFAQLAPVFGTDAPGLSVAVYGSSNGVQRTIVGQPFLGINQGGLGVQSLPANSLLIGQGFGPTGALPVGAITPFSPGQVLIDQGPGKDPQFRPIFGAININADGFATLTGANGPATANANFVLAGPPSGSPAPPAFRPLAAPDLPLATNSAPGAAQCDGTTTSCSGGKVTALGTSAATSIGPGVTTVAGGTNGNLLGVTTSGCSSGSPCLVQHTAGFLHSKDFGATGNGTTDDTTALQNWINACQTNGPVCFLDAGTYKITTALSVTTKITIEGAGVAQSILQPATSISGFNIVSTTNNIASNGVLFRNFAISYPSAAPNSVSGIILTASGANNTNQGSVFDHILMSNVGVGYSIGQAQAFVIRDCFVENITSGGVAFNLDNTGFTNPDTGDSTITGCTVFLTPSSTAINIASYAGLRVVNNKINSSAFGGSAIVLNLKNGINPSLLTVIGNSIENVTNAIVLQRAGTTGSFTNVVIANNEFEPGPGGAAVDNPSDANGVWLTNVMISGNILFGPGTTAPSFGYIVKAASGVQISNNLTVSNSTTNGFEVLATGGSNNCTLGPNGHGAGLFATSDLGCTTTATIAPN